MNCPSCNTPAPAGAVFCDNCGFDLRGAAAVQPVVPQQPAAAQPGGVVCPGCNHPNVGGAAFCENCGASLGAAPQLPAQPVYQPQQPAQPVYQAQQPVQPAGGPRCPSCGTVSPAGSAFCENCGTPLGAAPQQPVQPVYPPQPQPQPVYPPQQPAYAGVVTGRLVVQGTNTNLPITANKPEVILGREDPVSNVFPDVNLDPFGGHDAGVSRQHAKLSMQGGRLVLIDMGGPNGTFVNKQKLAANVPHPVNNGDEVRLGRLVMNYYTS